MGQKTIGDDFSTYLNQIENPQQRRGLETVLAWVALKFPNLAPKIAWNQPMFTDHETFIIGFSIAKQHLAVAPEEACINHFSEMIDTAGYQHTKQLIRMPWDQPIDFNLLEAIIHFNILEKKDYSAFWRKK
ncbi:MAG: iron chaperone [Eubacteriales bacterium]|nr:iron chaperone [Eubacteriales bacterium]